MKNKIGWCSMTFNPVWGCRNHCEYCYARRIAKRFWKKRYMDEFNYYLKKHPNWVWTGDQLSGLWKFEPTFLESQFDKKFPKKPQRIFVGSMSEIAHWEANWVNKVIFKIYEYPQHTFQFLTKYPEIYCKWDFPKNCWLGITITNSKDAYSEFRIAPENKDHIFFICIEPMLDYIPIDCIDYANWVIIGAETGNRRGKIILKKEWIITMIRQLRDKNIPIYLKDSIIKAYPDLAFEYPNFHKFPGFYNKEEKR